MIVVYIIAGLAFITSLFFYKKALTSRYAAEDILQKVEAIKIMKNKQQEEYVANLKQECSDLSEHFLILSSQVEKAEEQVLKLSNIEQEKLEKEISKNKEIFNHAVEEYISNITRAYDKVEKDFDDKVKVLEEERQTAEKELENLKKSLSAGVEAQLREREKSEALNFYKLTISDNEMRDIATLEDLKLSFKQPEVLSKLIWSTFFQKQTTDLCNRILGTNKKTGIYKLTNINTEQSYIGQSVDIATRWKAHIKCGLGIDAPPANRLYKAMQKEGVWNFTFELLEECPKDLLNQKEKFWIELYQTNSFGYNSTAGNK